MLVEKRTVTKNLIDIFEGRDFPQTNMDTLIDAAFKNKVLLHLLRVLNIQGPLRESRESGIREVVKIVQILSKILKDYSYAFFKLIKPVRYVPADVDLLVKASHINKVVKDIMTLGLSLIHISEPTRPY